MTCRFESKRTLHKKLFFGQISYFLQMRFILRPNLWGWFGLNSLWLAAQHGTSTRSAGDLDWQCQVVSCNPLAPWVENLWFKDTPGQNYLLYTPLCFQKYDICPKILFCDWSLFPKSILPSDGGDPKRPEQDANPPFSFTCSTIMTLAMKKFLW